MLVKLTTDHWPLQELDIQQQPIVDQQPGAGVPGGEVATGSAAVNGGAASTENGAAPPKDGVTKVSNVPRAAKTFRAYLPSCHRTYSCVHCRAHLANHDELISKSFQGSQVVNFTNILREAFAFALIFFQRKFTN